MRTFLLLIVGVFFTISCENNDDDNQRNPFLIDLNFSTQLSAIQTIDLEIPGNAIYVANGGIKGFFIINAGGSFLAWEASDPNHAPNDCSRMNIQNNDGLNVVCQCEDAHSYNLFTGQANNETLEFTMLNYRVNSSGGIITVSN